MWEKREQLDRFGTLLPEKWLKPRPASSLDWLICVGILGKEFQSQKSGIEIYYTA